MNRTEALQILAILKAAYPNSYKGMTKEEAMGTAAVWAMQFAALPVDVVTMAVHKAIATNTFPPAISEVKKKISGLYWEAYGILSEYRPSTSGELPEETKARCMRICECTRPYKHSGGEEPELKDLIPAISPARLKGGDTE